MSLSNLYAAEVRRRIQEKLFELPDSDLKSEVTKILDDHFDLSRQVAANRKADRSLVAAIAGSVAGGLVANTALTNMQIKASDEQITDGLAAYAVELARTIIKTVDKEPSK